jgi:hypothetical protein
MTSQSRLGCDHYTQNAFHQWCHKEDSHRLVSIRRGKDFRKLELAVDTNLRTGKTIIDHNANPDLPALGRRFFKQAHTSSRLGLGSYGNPSPSKIANSFAESLPSLAR